MLVPLSRPPSLTSHTDNSQCSVLYLKASEKFLVPKNIWSKKKICSKKIFVRKNFWSEMGCARTFRASVRACTLRSFSNFTCNLKIGSSSFSILVTKLSDHSFYEKRAVHARFGLVCAHPRSEHFKLCMQP